MFVEKSANSLGRGALVAAASGQDFRRDSFARFDRAVHETLELGSVFAAEVEVAFGHAFVAGKLRVLPDPSEGIGAARPRFVQPES